MRILFITLLTISLSACATATVSGYGQGGLQADGRSYEEAREDNRITADVNRLLVKNSLVRSMDIDVATREGVVTLSGRVPSREMAQRAEDLAAMVAGVKSVRNLLQVSP